MTGINIAELRSGFAVGFFTRAQAIEWADEQIDQSDAPPIDIIDLAMSGHEVPVEIESRLDALCGRSEPKRLHGLAVWYLRQLYDKKLVGLGPAIHTLRHLPFLEEGSHDTIVLEVEFHLAEDGIIDGQGVEDMFLELTSKIRIAPHSVCVSLSELE